MNKASRTATELSVMIARRMRISDDDIRHLRRGAILHDIGELRVPIEITNKTELLTDKERAQMMMHPQFAYDMMSAVSHLRPAVAIPYCHHERWDGSGYPRGLKGKQIPLAARIFAVVDVWDAMRTDKPYCDAWPDDLAMQYIEKASGTLFDPQIVRVFLDVLREIKNGAQERARVPAAPDKRTMAVRKDVKAN